MKTIAGILLTIAFCLASGVEANPIQGVYALVLMVAGAVCFNAADKDAEDAEKTEDAESIHIKKMEDAA